MQLLPVETSGGTHFVDPIVSANEATAAGAHLDSERYRASTNSVGVYMGPRPFTLVVAGGAIERLLSMMCHVSSCGQIVYSVLCEQLHFFMIRACFLRMLRQ